MAKSVVLLGNFVTFLLQHLFLLIEIYHLAALQCSALESIHLVLQNGAFIVGVKEIRLRRLRSFLGLVRNLIE